MMQSAVHTCNVCIVRISRRPAFSSGQPVQHSRSACGTSSGRAALQVCAAKSKGKSRMRQGYGAGQLPPTPPTPEPDPENVEFVLFVRNKALPRWVPLSIMNGGGPANTLVRSLDSGWGRALFSNVIVRSVGQALYKDKATLDRQCRQNIPELKSANDLEYGFKIRDKENPKNWYVAKNITVLPPAKQLAGTPLDNMRAFFSGGGN